MKVCAKCGSNDVGIPQYLNANDESQVANMAPDLPPYCFTCGAPTTLREKREVFLRKAKYGDGIDVVEYYVAPESSVLAGQTLIRWLDGFDTEAEAIAAYPDAAGHYISKWTAPQVSLSHLPSEADPVPGGMYPDDYDY